MSGQEEAPGRSRNPPADLWRPLDQTLQDDCRFVFSDVLNGVDVVEELKGTQLDPVFREVLRDEAEGRCTTGPHSGTIPHSGTWVPREMPNVSLPSEELDIMNWDKEGLRDGFPVISSRPDQFDDSSTSRFHETDNQRGSTLQSFSESQENGPLLTYPLDEYIDARNMPLQMHSRSPVAENQNRAIYQLPKESSVTGMDPLHLNKEFSDSMETVLQGHFRIPETQGQEEETLQMSREPYENNLCPSEEYLRDMAAQGNHETQPSLTLTNRSLNKGRLACRPLKDVGPKVAPKVKNRAPTATGYLTQTAVKWKGNISISLGGADVPCIFNPKDSTISKPNEIPLFTQSIPKAEGLSQYLQQPSENSYLKNHQWNHHRRLLHQHRQPRRYNIPEEEKDKHKKALQKERNKDYIKRKGGQYKQLEIDLLQEEVRNMSLGEQCHSLQTEKTMYHKLFMRINHTFLPSERDLLQNYFEQTNTSFHSP